MKISNRMLHANYDLNLIRLNQLYDYKADLTGIGNRSLISLDDTSAL